MAKFAPNLYHLFLELPARERFAAAAGAGFDAVEWHFPYEIPKAELKSLLSDNGLSFVNAVTPVDWKVSKGLAGQPTQVSDFRRSADLALEYATTCGFKTLHPGAGQIPAGVDRERCLETLKANLDYICSQAAGTPLVIAIEGVCRARFPNMILRTMAQAAEVVRAVNRPNLKLVYDTYHLRWEESGPLSPIMDEYWPLIGHIQIGNAPVRNEPGVGELDLHHLIAQTDRKGWKGWIGLEFDPSKDSWSSLMWANQYGAKVAPRRQAA